MANVHNAGNGSTMTEGFGSRAMQRTGETGTTALAAAAQAAVNARFIMALQRPRSWDEVRIRLLKECERKGFAEVARYAKPIGKDPSKWPKGPSIRFAEACLRYAGNVGVEAATIYEDREKRVLRVTAVDYETNASASGDVSVEKTVERRNAGDRVVVASRTNSYGEQVYIVEATEDDLLNKVNAAVSKASRVQILRLIPGDIVDECMAKVVETLERGAKTDPAGERKRLCDAFASIGVMPRDLSDYLGHSLDALQPAELTELRQIYATIRDGEATWAAVMEAKRGPRERDSSPNATEQASNIADKVKARAGKRGGSKAAATPPAAHDPKATQAPPSQPKVSPTAEPPPDAGDAWEGPDEDGVVP